MPDLGGYAAYVLVSYGAALGVIAALTIASLRASARARRELERLEARHGRRRGAASAESPTQGGAAAAERASAKGGA